MSKKMCTVCWLEYTVGTFKSHVKGPSHRWAIQARQLKAQKAAAK